MEVIASYSETSLLREHPPVVQRLTISNGAAEKAVLRRGSVIAVADGKNVLFGSEMTATAGVLAENVTVPAKEGETDGSALAAVYVHAAFIAANLIYADGVDDDDKAAAIAALKDIGCYAS